MDMGNETMDMGNETMHMMMQMTFTSNFPSEFLFAEWGTISTTSDKILACVGTFLLAILYEVFKDLRVMWNNGLFSKSFKQSSTNNPSTGDCCNDLQENLSEYTYNNCLRLVCQSFLHIFQIFISFVLMLIAMTYNYWLILAVCVGNGVGYLINGLIRRCITFSHKESNIENNQKDNNKISSCESTGERNSSYSADEYNNFDNDTKKSSTTASYRYPRHAYNYQQKVQSKNHHVYDNYGKTNNFDY